jgi:tRNA-specific adenosine deaminase 1
MKSIPASKIRLANGAILHDCHAEVLALRAFNHFLIQECAELAATGSDVSRFLRRRRDEEMTTENFQPFELREDVRIFMYCSEAPCGDASMELIMDAQDDATPWDIPEPDSPTDVDSPSLAGRGYFSQLGVVRRKPGKFIDITLPQRTRHNI